jgi:hypothetical protein
MAILDPRVSSQLHGDRLAEPGEGRLRSVGRGHRQIVLHTHRTQ